jgi:hypothetical protein
MSGASVRETENNCPSLSGFQTGGPMGVPKFRLKEDTHVARMESVDRTVKERQKKRELLFPRPSNTPAQC